jgi:hypothetical protein
MFIKKLIRKVFPYSSREQKVKNFVQRLKIKLQDFRTTPPILIYQMSKVGSSTVTRSLKYIDSSQPVYSIHQLSHEGIKLAEERFRSVGNTDIPDVLKLSKVLRKKIDRNGGIQGIPWKVITLVRDPIALNISVLFQNPKQHQPHLIDENNQFKTQEAMEKLQSNFKRFSDKSLMVTWFDREIKTVFGIDIYAYPFNKEAGYIILRQDNVELLVMRLEDLNRCGDKALSKFLHLTSPFQLLSANISQEKEFSEEYQFIKENILIPRNICENVYSTRLVRHFYSETEIEQFIKKWSKETLIKS